MYTGLQAGPSCICRRQLGWRFVPMNGHHRRRTFAGRPAPTGDRPSPAEALRLVFVGASLLAIRACKRSSPQANIRCHASSHRGKAKPRRGLASCLCRSQPAGESCLPTVITAGEHSLAGQLPQGTDQAPPRQLASCLCRSQPAGDSCRPTVITAGEHSPAGQLPQGQTKPRRGLASCLCRSQPAGDSCLPTVITAGEHSLAGQLPQGKSQAPPRRCGLSL
jgi:hypothetical protein